MKKIVIYTTITDNYDLLLNHSFQDDRCDYVCFSDRTYGNTIHDSQWEIRPLAYDKSDDVRNQRWHKIHPHKILPEYDYSLWIDANIDLLTPEIINKCTQHIVKESDVVATLHPKRSSLYQEFSACHELAKDDEALLKKQEEKVRSLHFSDTGRLFETGILLRNNKSIKITEFSESWWKWISTYSMRDQLSFTVAAWEAGITITPLSDKIYNAKGNKHIRLLPHIPNMKKQWDELTEQLIHTQEVLKKKEGWIKTKDSHWEVRRGEALRKNLKKIHSYLK